MTLLRGRNSGARKPIDEETDVAGHRRDVKSRNQKNGIRST